MKNLAEEEKNIIIENIISEFEYEKGNLKEEALQEEKNLKIEKESKKQIKKYIAIEVEENIEEESNEKNANEELIEVKNRQFKIPCKIESKLLYDGHVFNKDTHKPSQYPKIINYRCVNYRKNERQRSTQFCNALLKRKEENKMIYYSLEKSHSKECLELLTIIKKQKLI